MTYGRWRRVQARLLRVLSLERGALLWIPAVLLAGGFLLLGMHLAPSESALYTHSQELLLVLGPIQGLSDEPGVADTFRRHFRMHLERQREFSLVSEAKLQHRMQAMLGTSMPNDPLDWIRTTRNFKARFYLAGDLQRLADGDLSARLEVWEAAEEHAVDVLQVHAATPTAVGRILADSLAVTLFAPQLQRSARR